MTKLVVAFPNIGYALKNVFFYIVISPNRNLRTSPASVDIQEESFWTRSRTIDSPSVPPKRFCEVSLSI